MKPRPFDQIRARSLAHEFLALPPSHGWIERPAPIGSLIAEFVVPPWLCKTGNGTRHRPGWAIEKDKDEIWAYMATQWLTQKGRFLQSLFPLPGRPQVICVRFSEKEPDPFADWAKFPVDMLTVAKMTKPTKKKPITELEKRRLGIIADDKGSNIRLHQHWEPAKRKDQLVLIRVYTGKEKE